MFCPYKNLQKINRESQESQQQIKASGLGGLRPDATFHIVKTIKGLPAGRQGFDLQK
jgi:hypothetical protein